MTGGVPGDSANETKVSDLRDAKSTVILNAIRSGWRIAHSDKEGTCQIRYLAGKYSYYAGWSGGDTREEYGDADAFHVFLVHNAPLRDLDPCIDGYLGHLGLCALKAGDIAGAEAQFAHGLRLNYSLHLTGIALLHAEQSQLEQGRAVLQQIAHIVEQSPWRYRTDGFCRTFLSQSVQGHDAGHYLDLVTYWTLLLRLDSAFAEALVYRGWAYQCLDDTAAARADYEAALPLLQTPQDGQLRDRVTGCLKNLAP